MRGRMRAGSVVAKDAVSAQVQLLATRLGVFARREAALWRVSLEMWLIEHMWLCYQGLCVGIKPRQQEFYSFEISRH